MNETYQQLLQHMLGADERYRKKEWGFRNHFAASEGHEDLPHLRVMEDCGLVRSYERFGDPCFAATKLGAIAIGFKPAQLKRAGL